MIHFNPETIRFNCQEKNKINFVIISAKYKMIKMVK